MNTATGRPNWQKVLEDTIQENGAEEQKEQ